MCIGIIFQVVLFPIFGIFYYVLSGEDPFFDDYMNIFVNNTEKFLDWYKNKFGPK